MLRRLLLAATLLLTPAAACAEWREAETPHFVIWADSSEGELVKFAERLEGVDQLMRKATNTGPDAKVHKVRVFLVNDVDAVRRAYNGKAQDVAGFYTVNEAGPMAVSPRSTGSQSATFSADVVLAHEYGHHFMLQYLTGTFPSWYVEGFAELFSTAAPMGGGKFAYGKAAAHRDYSLSQARWLPVERLMTASYGSLNAEDTDFYGQSWLLTHYLTLNKTRAPQFRAYLNALSTAQSFEKAATAFGDLAVLNRELRKYLDGASFSYLPVPITPVDRAAIKLRTLTPGEAAMVPETIGMRDNIEEDKAKLWLAAIRAKAARYPADRYAQQLLADAEYVADEFVASAATADKVLAIAPGSADAMARKGMALLRQVKEAEGPARATLVRQARALFGRAYKAAPNKPLALIGNYQSYRASGAKVPIDAVEGLAEAVAIVPQDDGPRMMLVTQLVEDGNIDQAIVYLGPVAFSPHASGSQKKALALYEELKKKQAVAKTSAR